jgi:hypothetical protein
MASPRVATMGAVTVADQPGDRAFGEVHGTPIYVR